MTLEEAITLSDQKSIIFYDGICHLCNYWVRFLLKYDRVGDFYFAPLQSGLGGEVLRNLGLSQSNFQSVIILHQSQFYQKSEVLFIIAHKMGGLWRVLHIAHLIPKVFRDWIYDRVAAIRYQWFGKYDSCPIPPPEWRDRFIE